MMICHMAMCDVHSREIKKLNIIVSNIILQSSVNVPYLLKQNKKHISLCGTLICRLVH